MRKDKLRWQPATNRFAEQHNAASRGPQHEFSFAVAMSIQNETHENLVKKKVACNNNLREASNPERDERSLGIQQLKRRVIEKSSPVSNQFYGPSTIRSIKTTRTF